jgi:hypothetical protein
MKNFFQLFEGFSLSGTSNFVGMIKNEVKTNG